MSYLLQAALPGSTGIGPLLLPSGRAWATIITNYSRRSNDMATVRHIDPDRRDALRWLQGQLEWESTLRHLRNPEAALPDHAAQRPAA